MNFEFPDSRRIIASIRVRSMPSIPALLVAEITKAEAAEAAPAVVDAQTDAAAAVDNLDTILLADDDDDSIFVDGHETVCSVILLMAETCCNDEGSTAGSLSFALFLAYGFRMTATLRCSDIDGKKSSGRTTTTFF